MQSMLGKLMYFWMRNTSVAQAVAMQPAVSSHGRWLSKLTMLIYVAVLSSVHDGFLLLHIACKCKRLYVLMVVTEYTERHKSEHQMNMEETYFRKRK